MKVHILSEKLLKRIFISPAWAAASIHLNPFLRILRSLDSGSAAHLGTPPAHSLDVEGIHKHWFQEVLQYQPGGKRTLSRFIRAPNSANASSTGATDHERFLDSSDACQYTLLDRLRDMKLTGYGAAFAHEKVAGRPRGG